MLMGRRNLFAVMLLAAATIAVYSCSEDDVIQPEPDLITFPAGEFTFYQNLSDYGFFTGSLRELQPHDQVFLYDLSTPLFSDYTIKDRFIWMPGGASMNYRIGDVVDFPPGTFIIKNFSALDDADGELRLETRLLLLDPYDNEWKVMVYLWNDQQTDAAKHIIGSNINIRVKNSVGSEINTMYHVPNTNECIQCHNNNDVVKPIGPRIRSLNFAPAGSGNQLETWAANGRLTGLPSGGIPVLPDWLNTADFTLDERARAYLEMNCAHCHRQGGDAQSSGLFLDFDQSDSTHLGFYKTPLAAGPGTGGFTYDIVPGNASESIVVFRMNSTTPGIAMPESARSVIHEEGVALIREWIDSF